MDFDSLLKSRTWKVLCSLKLAITLASVATLLTVGGSLVMNGHPEVFAAMDGMILGKWFTGFGRRNPGLSWWVFAAACLLLMLGINTLCCFIDWLLRFRSRWRKTGEYLIHLGFVIVLIAYAWGNLAGFRSEDNRLFVGQTMAISELPGLFLHLESFSPKFNETGRPIDMTGRVSLLRGDEVLARKDIRLNHPLAHGGLVVLPSSFGLEVKGFRFFVAGGGSISLLPGTELSLENGAGLKVLRFFPDSLRLPGGRVLSRGDNLGYPALELELRIPGQALWRGWYFLAEGPPYPLMQAGVRLWPMEPIRRIYGVFTVNRDPGAPLALAGAAFMLAGVILALGSFYYKRARGDRPEIL